MGRQAGGPGFRPLQRAQDRQVPSPPGPLELGGVLDLVLGLAEHQPQQAVLVAEVFEHAAIVAAREWITGVSSASSTQVSRSGIRGPVHPAGRE